MTLASRIVGLFVAVAFCTSTHAALFNQTFNTDTANNAQTQAAYPDFTLTGGGTPSAIVNGGQLFIQNTGNNTQNFTRPGMGGDTRLSADISASNSSGNYNVGLSLGNNNIVFHPGFAGGALRVEGTGAFGNTNMGFTPANGTLHNLAIDTFAAIGLHRITFTDGDTNQSFTTSYINPTAAGGDVGLRRGGPPNGDSRFDNLSLAKPVLALNSIFSESFDVDAADTSAFNLAYPQIATDFSAGGSVQATGGNAVVAGDGGNDNQLLSIGTFTGEYVVQAEVGGTSNPGGWNMGLRVGENNITLGARQLAATAPNLAHLVHMGSHILIQTGDYDHAADTNIDASMADELYIGQPDQEGRYPLGSYQHNVHFVWVAASMEGRSLVALQQAQKLRDKVFETIPHQVIQQSTRYQNYMSSNLYTLTRFGYWNDILAMPAPPKEFKYVTAMWHYARATAFAKSGEPAKAWKEHEALMTIANGDILGGPSLSAMGSLERPSSPYQSDTKNLVMIAANAAAGEIAAVERKWDDAVDYLERAVNLQDNLAYTEPPPWHYPMRHSLGAVLLEAGRMEQAEDVYRDDLKMWPDNGWSLYGLMHSLRGQGRMDEARLLEKRYLKAFARADVALTATRY